VRRHARAFSIVPPASRCGPGSGVFSRSCQEGARRESVDPNYAQIRQQIIVVGDQRPFRRCAQRCEFSIVRSRTRTKALGSTGPLNSPSGWKRLATFSQSRRRIRRRIISISRWVDWFHISRKRPSRTAARTHADALLGLKPAATNTLVSITIPSILGILSLLAKGPATRRLDARSDRDGVAFHGFFLGGVRNDDPVNLLNQADAHRPPPMSGVGHGRRSRAAVRGSALPQKADQPLLQSIISSVPIADIWRPPLTTAVQPAGTARARFRTLPRFTDRRIGISRTH